MDNIFKIATSVATPLALAGLFAATLLYVLRKILSTAFIRKLTSAHSADVIKLIVDRLFVLALFAMTLGFMGYLVQQFVNSSPSAANSIPPQINVSGNRNTVVGGSNNILLIDSNLSEILREKSKPIFTTIPSSIEGHEIEAFEFKEEIPSIKIEKINSLIRETVLKFYKKNDYYKSVKISAKPTFIDYGLLGVSIDMQLEKINPHAISSDTPEKEAMFLTYMASAHPLEKSTGFVINIANAEPYEFKDLFRFNSMDSVSELMKSILKNDGRYYSCDDEKKFDDKFKFNSTILAKYLGYSADGCFSHVQSNANFYLTSSAVVIEYSRYEIGLGVIGAPEVTLPFDSIKSYVNLNGPLSFLNGKI